MVPIDQSELTFQDWKSISDTLNRLIQVCTRFSWSSEKLQNTFCKKKVSKRLNAINSWIYWDSKILETQRDNFAVFVWLDRANKIIRCGLFTKGCYNSVNSYSKWATIPSFKLIMPKLTDNFSLSLCTGEFDGKLWNFPPPPHHQHERWI